MKPEKSKIAIIASNSDDHTELVPEVDETITHSVRKEKLNPTDYTPGPIHVYSKKEIAEYIKSKKKTT